jgi:hypothetical protein
MSGVGEDKYFEVPEDRRAAYIEKRIVKQLPREKRKDTWTRANEIVASYQGCDADALRVLAFASERNLFDEYASKLEQFCSETLGSVPPQSRRNGMPGAAVISQFFSQCYDALLAIEREQ